MSGTAHTDHKPGGPVATRHHPISNGTRQAALTATLGGLLVLGLGTAGAGVYDAVSENEGLATLDGPALQQAIALRTPLSDRLVTWFTHLGGPAGMTVIAVTLTLLMIWHWRSWTPLILMFCAVDGSLTFTSAGKNLVGRARPPLTSAVPPYEHSFSFPSGHTLNSTVIAGVVAYLVARRLTSRLSKTLCIVVAVAWSGAMGLSRLFLGHHWLTDVIFAWLLGLAWLALIITAHRVYLAVRGPNTPP